jgi:hypothetical protein
MRRRHALARLNVVAGPEPSESFAGQRQFADELDGAWVVGIFLLHQSRRVRPDGSPPLRPVIVTLAAWGNARLAPKARSMILVDTQTGEEVEPIVVDATTGPLLDDSIAFAYAVGRAASDAMCARYPNTTWSRA